MEDILDNLNDSQRTAVEWCDGPQLVIAVDLAVAEVISTVKDLEALIAVRVRIFMQMLL